MFFMMLMVCSSPGEEANAESFVRLLSTDDTFVQSDNSLNGSAETLMLLR
ncbi:MAG: hypothetical protein PHO37_11610 [Kiritimatiellae bacterium]|nr:hypothetical protein [Kiritimatiellia bacterium]